MRTWGHWRASRQWHGSVGIRRGWVAPDVSGRAWARAGFDADAPSRGLEERADGVGDGAVADHATTEGRIGHVALARLTQQRLDVGGAVGELAPKPVEEDVVDLIGQAEEDIARARGACFSRGMEEGGGSRDR